MSRSVAVAHSLQSRRCRRDSTRHEHGDTAGGRRSSPRSARRAGTPAVLEQLIEAGADVFRLNFSHADRERHARTIEAIRAAAERVGREVAVLGDLPGPKLRIGELRDDVAELETGMHVTLTPREVEGDRETIPVAWPGVTSPARGRARLPRRRRDPPAGRRPATTAASTAEVEVGGTLSSHKGMNIPGGDRPAGDHRRRPRLGRVRGRARRRPARRLLRLHRRRPRRRSSERLRGARLRHPADRQDREASRRPRTPRRSSRAATGGIMVARGDLGIEVPLARGAGRAEAADPRRRPALEAGDHRDPDAGLDGDRAAPDPGRGDRRRQRDLRRHRRGDALRGDRGRPEPGRGGAGDGPDRPRHRARPAATASGSSAAPTRRPRTSPTRSPRAPSAPSTGSG